MKLKDITIKEFFKTLDYYNSLLFENSFSDKFIYNSNAFSVNEKLSVRFLKVVIDNQWYSEKDFEELLEAPYNNLIQFKLQNKLKDSLRFSFIFKKGNNFVFKKKMECREFKWIFLGKTSCSCRFINGDLK